MKRVVRSGLVALWFMLLTFPIMVIRVNTIERTVAWRWVNLAAVGAGAFALFWLWETAVGRRSVPAGGPHASRFLRVRRLFQDRRNRTALLVPAAALGAALPFLVSEYRVNVLITSMIYVVLGLGLNIVVGLAGLLDLGYVAFYAVGAYTYALLNHHYGLDFWLALPLGGLVGAVCGVLLGIPVLRLRGDYLAIVTLGFGEIIRIVLENWNALSFGPSGIANIPAPTFLGRTLPRSQGMVLIYYLMIALLLFTVFVVGRLKDSRLGRSWEALREDEVACQAMGIDRMRTKLAAFALGATWAGMMGVVFAAKTTFINPASFTFLESALVLSIVVLGGMGSIPGVILAAFVLVLLSEQLRAFSQYRMLIFGASMVLMMVFRPQGMVASVRRTYRYVGSVPEGGEGAAGSGA